MNILQDILLGLHMVGLAAIVGGWLTHFKPATVTVWQVYGAIIHVVTTSACSEQRCLRRSDQPHVVRHQVRTGSHHPGLRAHRLQQG